jgi:hypothetical protein
MPKTEEQFKKIAKKFANLKILATANSRVEVLHTAFRQDSALSNFSSSINWDGPAEHFMHGLKGYAKSKFIDLEVLYKFIYETCSDTPDVADQQIFEEIRVLLYT